MNGDVILSNGTRIENAYCLEVNGSLFVYIIGATNMKEYFDVFYDNDIATGVILDEYPGDQTRYEGYTSMFAISRDNGNINIVMRKEI